MDEDALRELRLECLRLAVEFGSARDSEDSRKDGGPKKAKNSRNVRKGSEPQTQTTMLT